FSSLSVSPFIIILRFFPLSLPPSPTTALYTLSLHDALPIMDAVHDAHHARRAPVPTDGRLRSGARRRCRTLADLPLHHPAPPAPLHRARHSAGHDLHRAELRHGLHHDLQRTRHGDPALRHLPGVLRLPGLPSVLCRRRHRRRRLPPRRHHRSARGIHPAHGGELMSTPGVSPALGRAPETTANRVS